MWQKYIYYYYSQNIDKRNTYACNFKKLYLIENTNSTFKFSQ